LLLVGLEIYFEGTILGKLWVTTSYKSDRLIDNLLEREGFENSPFDERTRQIVAKTKCH
jgi:hypothetical protein